MSIEKINKKFYREVDQTEITSKLENLKAQKQNINYDALREEYKQSVANMQQYEASLDTQIVELEKVLEPDKTPKK